MGKKDQVSTNQLEHVLNELNAGREETTATAVLGQRSRAATHRPGASKKLFFNFWGLMIFLMTILLAAIVAGTIWFLSGSTFKQESTTFVEQIQELATLATSEAHVKVIIEQEDNKIFGKNINFNLPGTKRKVLLVVPATVIAGVDLKGVTADDMKVNDKEKELSIVLPPAALIQDPAIQMEQVRTFSDEGLFRGKIEWADGFDLAALAQKQIKDEAIEIGILQSAEKNAEIVLKEFFRNLGYDVNISFSGR